MTRHRKPSHRRAWRIAVALCAAVAGVATVVSVVLVTGRSSPSRGGTASGRTVGGATAAGEGSRGRAVPAGPIAPWAAPPARGARGQLRPGSDPSVLPSSLLIADKLNDRLIVVDPRGRVRWLFPGPGDLAAGQTFRVPDDAFFTPDGRYIIATQEDEAVITLIDVARRRIVYRYGVTGQPGTSANHLSNPDDAMVLPDHYVLTADIKNCRILLIAPRRLRPARVIGTTTTVCRHAPPGHWGSPNGVFPLANGHYLVTEINGDWVDEINLRGTVFWSVHPPRVAYPSDSNQIGPDRFLTVDYSSPGEVVIFDRAGRSLWRYTGTGRGALDHPSLALPLPNGDVIVNDDYNHRVVVIDPRSDRIVWQYGVTGVAGRRPGYLDNPDGIDLVPPYSLLVAHRATMGTVAGPRS